jgi:hypothetical protein
MIIPPDPEKDPNLLLTPSTTTLSLVPDPDDLGLGYSGLEDDLPPYRGRGSHHGHGNDNDDQESLRLGRRQRRTIGDGHGAEEDVFADPVPSVGREMSQVNSLGRTIPFSQQPRNNTSTPIHRLRLSTENARQPHNPAPSHPYSYTTSQYASNNNAIASSSRLSLSLPLPLPLPISAHQPHSIPTPPPSKDFESSAYSSYSTSKVPISPWRKFWKRYKRYILGLLVFLLIGLGVMTGMLVGVRLGWFNKKQSEQDQGREMGMGMGVGPGPGGSNWVTVSPLTCVPSLAIYLRDGTV